ncbi:MAG: sigma-70 family RNA polymerase sigma factor [Actinomycetota bacterium]
MAAYEELVRRHQQAALRVATLVAGADTAEDAVQEAFLKAYGALKRFRSGSSFRPWILKITANEARNKIRSTRRHSAIELRLAAGRPSGDAAPLPEAVVLEREAGEGLVAALSRLSERDRLVICYRYLLDLTEAETAEALGVRQGTVKSRLSRALARLRTELDSSVDRGETDD